MKHRSEVAIMMNTTVIIFNMVYSISSSFSNSILNLCSITGWLRRKSIKASTENVNAPVTLNHLQMVVHEDLKVILVF